MDRLARKVAIVTGSAMGIGRATAMTMAAEGAAVRVADRDIEHGQRVVAEIKSHCGTAEFQPTDVGISGDVEQMVAAAVD